MFQKNRPIFTPARDRCYDFKNIFAEKDGENVLYVVFFAQATASF
jgi:hypothetical protein